MYIVICMCYRAHDFIFRSETIPPPIERRVREQDNRTGEEIGVCRAPTYLIISNQQQQQQ